MKTYLGVDVGSVSTKFVLINEQREVLKYFYFRTEGDPIRSIQSGLSHLKKEISENIEIASVGTTGSARYLAGVIVGADLVKNEISAHAKGAGFLMPEVRTVIEIGGQDSKIILLENGVVVDFAMNLICAAGTGSFLDAQSFRMGIPVEKFGELALKSGQPTIIGSRCTVFAESDMIHKQQIGHTREDIIAGLCHGLARNYLSNVAKSKKIESPIIFLGGVSENLGMRKAFEEVIGSNVIVPQYNTVVGALGMAILAQENAPEKSKFRGWEVSDKNIKCTSFQCNGCPNMCEVIEARIDDKVVSRWNDRCGKYSNLSY